jgi:hypothetical protein
MVVVARADLLYAVTDRLRSFSELTTMVSSAAGWNGTGSGPRIGGERRSGANGWAMPTSAIVVRRAGGPVRLEDVGLGHKTSRLDIVCYGQTAKLAADVWRMLDAVLVPASGGVGGQHVSFTLHGARIDDVVPETDAMSLIDPELRWPFVLSPYVFSWWSV